LDNLPSWTLNSISTHIPNIQKMYLGVERDVEVAKYGVCIKNWVFAARMASQHGRSRCVPSHIWLAKPRKTKISLLTEMPVPKIRKSSNVKTAIIFGIFPGLRGA